MQGLSIHLFDTLHVTLDGKPISHFETDKVRAMLVYLAMEHEHPHRRETIAGLLWPDFPDLVALRNVRLSFFRLRKALEDDQNEQISRLFQASRQTLAFHPSAPLWVDAVEFETLLAACDNHAHQDIETCPECIQRIEKAVALYRGDFLSGFNVKEAIGFEEWLVLKREHLRHLAVTALDRLTTHHLLQAETTPNTPEQRSALENAQICARRLLELEPWRESVHRQLMLALERSGQPQAALVQYQVCRNLLQSELGIEPDEVTTALYEQIRARQSSGEPGAVQRKAPQCHNLPPQFTLFFGRDAELSRLGKLMLSYRWITLVGEGGIGKTRLALAAAERLVGNYPGGAWFVPLTGLGFEDNRKQNRDFLSSAIASAMNLRLNEEEDGLRQLGELLPPQKILLLLDGFEHLVTCADYLLDLLGQAPQLSILVTSRHVLNFQAGYVMRVEGLPTPENTSDPEALFYSSVRLFAERAARGTGEFEVNESNLTDIIRICQVLDGLPLAIELAATLTNEMPLQQIAEQIHKDLDFLTTSLQDIPSRHRDMRTVFESSWDLLTPKEQLALARCSVFPGSFGLEAALAITGASPADIKALVDKSLVHRPSPGRYQLHELLRQFAAEKLTKIDEF